MSPGHSDSRCRTRRPVEGTAPPGTTPSRRTDSDTPGVRAGTPPPRSRSARRSDIQRSDSLSGTRSRVGPARDGNATRRGIRRRSVGSTHAPPRLRDRDRRGTRRRRRTRRRRTHQAPGPFDRRSSDHVRSRRAVRKAPPVRSAPRARRPHWTGRSAAPHRIDSPHTSRLRRRRHPGAPRFGHKWAQAPETGGSRNSHRGRCPAPRPRQAARLDNTGPHRSRAPRRARRSDRPNTPERREPRRAR